MGITGLIPFMEKSSKKTNISEFAGGTVAVDTYCWLHKGAFSCADKIILGQPTDAYVKFCMKFVNMLLSHNIKPILVFDGRHLPAKAETEVKRRENRAANKKRAAELMKMGKVSEGRNLLRRSLDVSHNMALEVMKACQAQNVDCIVAPYEADAQLAYLNISGIADVVITEDSDLTLFGCKKIFFKMDLCGNGILVEQNRLHLSMGLRVSDFNMDKFRYMCIISGCDYLASLPGIGLNKARKFIVSNTDQNIYNAILRLPSSLNMKQLVVTQSYRDGFMRALATFKHQLVYCPINRTQVRLYPPTPDITEEQLKHAGTEVDDKLAYQLALGNCDPFSFKKLHNFDPDTFRPKRTNAWSGISVADHPSIWSKGFNEAKENKLLTTKKEKNLPVTLASNRGKVAVMKLNHLKKDVTPAKRSYEECQKELDDIIDIYRTPKTPSESMPPPKTPPQTPKPTDPTISSPILARRRSNPFRRRLKLPERTSLYPTVIDDSATSSEFFATKSRTKINDDALESMAVNLDEDDCKENMKMKGIETQMNVIIPETEYYEDTKNPLDRSILVQDTQDLDVSMENIFKKDKRQKTCIIAETQDLDISMAYAEKSNTIIPETEDCNELLENDENNLFRQDSGYKSSPVELDNNQDMNIEEKEPLHSLDNAIIDSQQSFDDAEMASNEADENDSSFFVPQEVFLETHSSLFKFNAPDKPVKSNFTHSTGWIKGGSVKTSSSGTGGRTSSNRKSLTRSNSKKNTTIQGQQSLLNMFAFQKKNTFKH